MNDTTIVVAFVALLALVGLWDAAVRRHDRRQELDVYERMRGGGWG